MTAPTLATRLRQLETMLLIRAFEEQLVELQRNGAPGTCTSVGQEACAVGVIDALESRDRILTNHRSAAHLLARGADPQRLIAEVLGRVDGYCSGRSGSLHISAKELGVVLTSTIVGGELSLAPGVALAQKMGQGEPGAIATVFFGDGACQEGEFHEALNLAGIWRLPLLFVCENNHYGVNTAASYSLAAGDITRMPEAYHIPNRVVHGNDVEAVYEAAGEAIDMLRRGEGPYFLECETYRWHKHFLSDGLEDLRPREELEAWAKRCPVMAYESKLLKQGALTRADVERIDGEILERVEEAYQFALDSPYPEPEDALEDVYSL